MRRVGFVTAACAILAIARPVSAQVIIEGAVDCTTAKTYTNQDVIIRDVILDGCSSCSLSVTVYNGTITLDFGSTGTAILGAGDDGTHAIMGDVCVVGDNIAAGPAKPGCNITLQSLKPLGGPATRPLGVFVLAAIDVHGGHGGQGANGNSDVFLSENCGRCGPDNGLAGTPGAAGGSVSITSNGPVVVSAGINTSGGNGGSGGWGGSAQFGNGAGVAAPGSAGGNGGSVTITQSVDVTGVSLSSSIVTSGGDGGFGGWGGSGGTGAAGVTSGAAGGNGGNGGAVKVVGLEIGAFGGITTFGGHAGDGGSGGSSPAPGYICMPCRDDDWETFCSTAIQGGSGGVGGKGGAAGTITMSTVGDLTLGLASSFSAIGGNGGAGGWGGIGSVGYADCGPCPYECDPTCECGCPLEHAGECPSVAAHGPAAAGGAGGAGGATTVKAKRLLNQGLFSTLGGCGGQGAPGWQAMCATKCSKWTTNDLGQPCCCLEELICSVVEASKGAPGGAGGKGGNISLSLTIPMVPPLSTFEFCGGGGGAGGDGGDGFTCLNGDTNWVEPGDGGGAGGIAGGGGTFSYPPGPSQICIVPRPDCGEQVMSSGGPVYYHGRDGTDGSHEGCTCVER